MVDKLSEDNSMVGANETRNKINEIVDDAGGDFSAAAVTVADEGGDLTTAATKLDFVGAGVAASGTGATKTITISGGSIGPVAGAGAYSTGWLAAHGGVTVANGSTHVITHNLGTADVSVAVYVSANSSGTSPFSTSDQADAVSGEGRGVQITALSANTCTVQLSSHGYITLTSAGVPSFATAWTSKYIKVIVATGGGGITVAEEGSDLSTPGTKLNFVGAGVTASGTGTTKTITVSAGGGGSGGGYSTGWGTSHGGVTVADGSTHTITHNLGTTDVMVQAYANSSASDTNAMNIDGGLSGTSAAYNWGGTVTSITTNTVTFQLAESGYLDWSSAGHPTGTSYASKYVKIIVSTGGGGGGPSSPVNGNLIRSNAVNGTYDDTIDITTLGGAATDKWGIFTINVDGYSWPTHQVWVFGTSAFTNGNMVWRSSPHAGYLSSEEPYTTAQFLAPVDSAGDCFVRNIQASSDSWALYYMGSI